MSDSIELVQLLIDYLENSKTSSQAQLIKIISATTKIKALIPLSKLKQKEIDHYTAEIIQKAVRALNVLRVKGKDVVLSDWINACQAISYFSAINSVTPQGVDVTELIDSLTLSKMDQNIKEYISQFSERLRNLKPKNLMRSANFENEMEKAINSLRNTSDTSILITGDASNHYFRKTRSSGCQSSQKSHQESHDSKVEHATKS